MLKRRFRFLLGFVLFFSTSVHAESVVEEMIAAWKTREARYQTGHIEFENIEKYNHDLATDPGDPEYGFDGTAPLKHLIIFDKKRGRYTRNGLSLDANTGSWLDKNYTATFDGDHSWRLFYYERKAEHPPGFVDNRGSILGRGWDYHSTPVFMAFRPLTKSLQGLDPRELGNPIRRTRVNGHDVVVYAKGSYEYSFDPQREYVLLRQEMILSGPPPETVYRLDINYLEDPEWGVVPKDWTLVKLAKGHPGVVMRTIQGNIIDMKFNQPVSKSDFVIDFPPGAVVNDAVNKRHYVVREDGSARKYDRTEKRAGVTYDEMMTTVAPSVIAERKKRYWIIAVIAVVGTIAFWIYRR